MATIKDPVTGTMGNIGDQNATVYNQDVLGAQARAQRMANSTGQQANNIVNKTAVNPVINGSNLTEANPMKLQAPQQNTGFSGLAGSIEEQAKQYSQSLVDEKSLQDTKTTKDSLLNKITEKLAGNKGKTQLEDQAAAPVDLAKKELNDINNQILQEQTGLRRTIEDIQKNKEGLFGGAMQQAIDKATRESVSKQADLSIIQMAKQNNYSAAKEIADRKVAAQLEQQKNELDALEFAYQENKDMYTKQEQRQFEANQAERKRLLDNEETKLKTINDLAIDIAKNGAPADVIKQVQNAKNINEAMALGGTYLREKKSGSGSSTKIYTANTIPSDIKLGLIEDIVDIKDNIANGSINGNTINDLYQAYPEVSTDYIDSLFETIQGKEEVTAEETKKPFRFFDISTWFK